MNDPATAAPGRPAHPDAAARVHQNAGGALLRASNLHKTYMMGRVALPVLQGCSLSVRPGEFLMIMGRSGSGKSTLLHLLGALDAPDQGELTLGDLPYGGPQHERRRIQLRRSAFGFVFQFYHLLPELNVFQNVLMTHMVGISMWRWPRERARARACAREILEQVGLGHRLRHHPRQLSGGERQRVAIARALVHRPQVLFADEPTGNLDAQAGANIMELLSGLHRAGQTTVMVTHDQSLTRYADRVLTLDRGVLQSE
jgi:lipoprotein-releasing system ATP-binding protein